MQAIKSLGYTIHFDDTLAELSIFIQQRGYPKVFVLVDRNTGDHCLPLVQQHLAGITDYDIVEVDPGEENKNIDFCIGIWKTLLDFGADRKSLLLNLGGGVITDMGGFAASTYKRGIDFVQVPTTLLAQVDASVGGKTGIDLDGVKNIIGTFTQPQAVFIAHRFLETLDERQLTSGFAEMIKHGLILDADYYQQLRALGAGHPSPEMIHHSVRLKNEVVLGDPQERGRRKILNFGHTIGHAVETWSLETDEPLLHGEAIAMGMICEAYLSHRVAGLPLAQMEEIIETIRNRFGLIALPEQVDEDLLSYMANDKKNEQQKIGFALLSEIGQCGYDLYPDPALILESLAFYRGLVASDS